MTLILKKVLGNIWPMLVDFLTAIILMRFFYFKNNRQKFVFYDEMKRLFSIIYIWLLFEILTMTEINTNSGVNLVPFSEIFRYNIGTNMFNYNVLGNILIFIPLGFIISEYIKPKNIWPVIFTTAITSIVVEFVQLKIGRSFDIDDIILNLVGAILGYFIYKFFTWIYQKLPDFCKKESIKNIVCIVIIALLAIYFLGYWSVVFK